MRVTTAIAALWLCATACSGRFGVLELSVVTSPDDDLLSRIQRVTMRLSTPPTESSTTRTASGLSLSLDVDATASGVITLDAFDAAGTLIAVGRSAPLPLRAVDARIAIYLAPPLSIGRAAAALPVPRSDIAVAPVSAGAVLVGGTGGGGEPRSEVDRYNALTHTFEELAPLPEARAASSALADAEDLLVVFGGRDESGTETATLTFLNSRPKDAPFFLGDSQGAAASAEASIAQIGASSFVVAGAPPIEISSRDGTARNLLDAPALDGELSSVRLESGQFLALALGQGVATTGAAVAQDGTFGERGAPASAQRTGHRVVSTPTGLIAIGGRTSEGLERSVVRRPRGAPVLVEFPSVLRTPRIAAAVAATDAYLLVAGGRDSAGNVLGDVEVFDARTLEPVATLPLVVPRTRASAVALPTGQIAIVGGETAAGGPIATVELFTPPN